MRYKIISIVPQIVDVSTNEESDYTVNKTLVRYQIVQFDPTLIMDITAELAGYATLIEVKTFIKNQHDRTTTSK